MQELLHWRQSSVAAARPIPHDHQSHALPSCSKELPHIQLFCCLDQDEITVYNLTLLHIYLSVEECAHVDLRHLPPLGLLCILPVIQVVLQQGTEWLGVGL